MEQTPAIYHKSVLMREVLQYLAPRPHGTYVDATFGGGGHTRAILEAEPTCKVIAFDWDPEAFAHNKEAIERDFPGRVTWIWRNFVHLTSSLKKIGVSQVDGILADFGTSQYQIHFKPGFSFAKDTFLDMRMYSGQQTVTAYEIVKRASEEELAKIFWEYGGERYGRQIARAIVAERKKRDIRTTGDLVDVVQTIIWPGKHKIHPATRVFQALRIVVNKELDNINSFLQQTQHVLAVGGHLVCISFHSLEDRLVKQFIRDYKHCFKNLTPKVVTAQEDELSENASSRSACLRAAERTSNVV